MSKIEKMNQLVADLAVLNVMFHNMHWNIIGSDFMPIHKMTEEAYDDFFAKYDEVAERMKMLGEFPAGSLSKYLKLTKVSELEDQEWTATEVLNVMLDAYKYLKDEFTLLRDLALKEEDFVTAVLAEDYIGEFDKQIWFITSMLK